jgi:stress-induced-phosphoprotein 1
MFRAQARMGNAYFKQNNLTAALKSYNESLSNFRLPDVEQQVKKIEKQLEEDSKKAYIDPKLSAEAKERGNALVKDGKYPEAIKEYEEAVKRNPEDHTLYANRAMCYMKLQAPDQGIKDCDECIKRKPDFVKAYIRKGLMFIMKKEYNRALQAFDEGSIHDPNNAEIKDGMKKCYQAMGTEEENLSQEEKLKKAAADPEVQEILSDPIMRQILSQMTNDPNAARDHLRNPEIAAKIQKLMKAGIIGTK